MYRKCPKINRNFRVWKTEIDLLGEPKVDLKVFTNSAVLSKKEK